MKEKEMPCTKCGERAPRKLLLVQAKTTSDGKLSIPMKCVSCDHQGYLVVSADDFIKLCEASTLGQESRASISEGM